MRRIVLRDDQMFRILVSPSFQPDARLTGITDWPCNSSGRACKMLTSANRAIIQKRSSAGDSRHYSHFVKHRSRAMTFAVLS